MESTSILYIVLLKKSHFTKLAKVPVTQLSRVICRFFGDKIQHLQREELLKAPASLQSLRHRVFSKLLQTSFYPALSLVTDHYLVSSSVYTVSNHYLKIRKGIDFCSWHSNTCLFNHVSFCCHYCWHRADKKKPERSVLPLICLLLEISHHSPTDHLWFLTIRLLKG